MRDARPSGHEIELARPNELLTAQTVLVQHLALEQPGHGLQSDVRMRTNSHRLLSTECDRAVVIEEAPRPDQPSRVTRKRPANDQVPGEHRLPCRIPLDDGGGPHAP